MPRIATINPSNRYNMDETGILEGKGDNGLVLGRAETTSWNDSTIVGKRLFISCYQKARLAGLTVSNIKAGWKYTGLWPVAIAKPLMSGLLLQKTTSSLPAPTTPTTPVNNRKRGAPQSPDADIEGWASAVKWSTPRKQKELDDQLRLFSQLDQTMYTTRLLFKKVKKGFQEQYFQLAAARHQIQLLQAKVDSSVTRKRKAVVLDLNTKFATIKDVRQAQIEAGDAEDSPDESSASELSSEAESCIVVASKKC
ncbi:putative transposase [Colletotrichum sublineola]|uniref:Putative transposase n=1 Tax=Colletotrichum sublineola TaxID=1173701 RepID=A0A066WX55_COLSU|nr:putative transposase [Colletotrichum sublineola]